MPKLTIAMKQYHLKEHFSELKKRLLIVLVSFMMIFLINYIFFSDMLFQILINPLQGSGGNYHKIIYTGLTEAFVTYLKLAAFAALLVIVPILSYQIYAFIKPGLYKEEKTIATIIFFLAPFLFWSGGFFVYYYVMPKAWQFFLSFEKTGEMPLLLEARISEYLGLVIQFILAFGIAFELPLIMIILNLLGLVEAESLKSKRRFAIVIIFIIAGILTPPDILSQFALAIPMLLLYEISIRACKFIEGKRSYARH
jgi:sec-independent protein translocase protein TatC